MQEGGQFQNSNFAEVFGELQSVHRLRRGCFQKFGIPLIILAFFFFGVIAYLESNDIWALPVCALPFLILFIVVVRHTFLTRGDELRIYEGGFAYRSKGQTEICLWEQIKSYKTRELNDWEKSQTPGLSLPLAAIEKENGELIEFEHELEGTPEIISRWENFKKKKNPPSAKTE